MKCKTENCNQQVRPERVPGNLPSERWFTGSDGKGFALIFPIGYAQNGLCYYHDKAKSGLIKS